MSRHRRIPSVPEIIEDRQSLAHEGAYVKKYKRLQHLGQGGFAHVFEVRSVDSGAHYACKVIEKRKLRKAEYKRKMWSEIQIHRKLKQRNIINLLKYFEDTSLVYIVLELCNHSSCMCLIRSRKYLNQCETRFLMTEIMDAVAYLHSKCVIHRDLKIGNILLSNLPPLGIDTANDSYYGKGMHVKLCDFGLAAQMSDKDDFRVTICGTPNYIAPEILIDGGHVKPSALPPDAAAKWRQQLAATQKHAAADKKRHKRPKAGHSFGVDIWSLGVILFTFLTGKPPFETKRVDTTYEKITSLSYCFPKPPIDGSRSAAKQSRYNVSDEAKNTIASVLKFDAKERPTIEELRRQPFFCGRRSLCPTELPTVSLRREASIDELFPLGIDHPSYHHRLPPLATAQSPLMKKGGFDSMKTALTAAVSSSSLTSLTSSSVSATSSGTHALASAELHSRALRPPPIVGIDTMQTESSARFQREKQQRCDTPMRKLLRHTRVCKYLDYTSRYGLGLTFSDGRNGIQFNDSTHMIMLKAPGRGHGHGPADDCPPHSASDSVRYFGDNHLVKDCRISQANDSSAHPKDVCKKLALMKHFSEYLDKNNHCKHIAKSSGQIKKEHFFHVCALHGPVSSSSTHSEEDSATDECCVCLCCTCHKHSRTRVRRRRHGDADSGEEEEVVYVKKWLETSQAILFRLSNSTTQVHFRKDNTAIYVVKVPVSEIGGLKEESGKSKKSVVFFRNKLGVVEEFPLSEVMKHVDSSKSSVCKRMAYTRTLLRRMLEDGSSSKGGGLKQLPASKDPAAIRRSTFPKAATKSTSATVSASTSSVSSPSKRTTRTQHSISSSESESEDDAHSAEVHSKRKRSRSSGAVRRKKPVLKLAKTESAVSNAYDCGTAVDSGSSLTSPTSENDGSVDGLRAAKRKGSGRSIASSKRRRERKTSGRGERRTRERVDTENVQPKEYRYSRRHLK